MAKTKKILKQMMIFSFSAALTMGNGISVSADPNAEENIPDDVILHTEQSQEEADFFSSNPEIGDFSSGSADSNAENNNTNDNNDSDGSNSENNNTNSRNTDSKDTNNSNDSNNNNSSDNSEDDNKSGDSNTSLDINNLADGIYSASGTMLKTDKKTASMADQAFNHTIKLTVKDGTYSLTLDFKAMDMNGQMGYLGNIKYYKTGYTLDQNGNPQGETEESEVNSLQKYTDDTVVSDYFGTDYPDIVTFPMIEEAKTDSYVPLQVFIPIMDAIAKGTGTQNVFLKMDWSTLKETSDDDEAFKDDSSNGASNENNNGSNNGNSNSSNGNNTNGNGSSNNGNSSIGGNNNNAGNNNGNGNTNNSGNNTNNSGYVNNAGLGGNSSLKKTNSSGSGSESSLNGNSSLKGNSSLSGNSSLKSSGNSGTDTSKTSGNLSSESLNNGTLEGADGQKEMASNTDGTMGMENSASMNTSAVTQMSSGSQAEQSSATAWEASTQQYSAKKAGAMIPVWISAAAAACGLGYKVKTGANPKRRKKR